MDTNLQQVLNEQHALEEQTIALAAEAFNTLGYRIIAGEVGGPEEVRRTLADADKNDEDLAAIVQKIERRIVLAAQLKDAERADERTAEIDGKMEVLDKAYAKVTEKYTNETEPLRQERSKLAAAKQQGVVARQALIDTTLNPSVAEELADLAARRTANARRKGQIQGVIFETSVGYGRQPRRGLSLEKKKELEAEDQQIDQDNEAIDQRRAELSEQALTP